jgi:hypothetical protein
VQILGIRHPEGLVLRFVEVIAEFDYLGAEGGDGGVLVEGIVAGYIDGRGNPGTRGGSTPCTSAAALSKSLISNRVECIFTTPLQCH